MRIHFLRWDAALAAFETEALLRRHPETANVTHPVIRKAAGLWSRQAVSRWRAEFSGPEDVLIGELPISGNRFAELVHVHDDDAELLLAGDLPRFFVPVPMTDVRHLLESKRQESLAAPRHTDEGGRTDEHASPRVTRDPQQGDRARSGQLGRRGRR